MIIRLSIMLLILQNAVVSAKMTLNAKTLALENQVLDMLINVIRKREATLKAEVNSYHLPLIYRHVHVHPERITKDSTS